MKQKIPLSLGHTKNDGIALPLAFLTSMFVLILALYTLNSISRSFQRTVGIERSNKVFFASESGVEAALFHKNSRKKGAHFDWENWENASGNLCKDNPEEDECPTWLKTIRLNHQEIATEARWKLESRFIPTDDTGGLVYNGFIKEFQAIEIPFYYDPSMLPTNNASTNNDLIAQGIILDFPTIALSAFNFGDNRAIVPPSTTSIDTATQKKERPLIDWSISRFNATSGVQTFVPETNLENPCGKKSNVNSPSEIICETEILDGSTAQEAITLNSNTIEGKIEPCPLGSCDTNLNAFFFQAGAENSDFKLRLQSLLPYEDTDGTKIAAIPFTITLVNTATDLTKSQYTITSTVTKGDYTKETSFIVDESAGIGAFNYVIFE